MLLFGPVKCRLCPLNTCLPNPMKNYRPVSNLSVGLFVFSTSYVPSGKIGSTYLGKAIASARAALSMPNSAYVVFTSPQSSRVHIKVWLPVLGTFNVCADVNPCVCTQGCTDTVRESALKVGFGRKIPCRILQSNLRQRRVRPTLYQLPLISISINPLTTRVVGAPQMIS